MLDQPSDDAALTRVRGLELSLLIPQNRLDATFLHRVLHQDFVEFGASGRTWTRPNIIADLTSSSPAPSIEVTAMTARRIDTDTILITYHANRAGLRSLRSSIWVQHQGDWTLLFHQGTLTTLE